jgi:hypothetical protein
VEAGELAKSAQSRALEAGRQGSDSGKYIQNGYGVFVDLSGNRYRGEIREGKRNGYGIDEYPDGSRYEGENLNDQKSGHGVYIYSNGGMYEGEFASDHANGWGEYYHRDGSRYEGWSTDDKHNGPGVLIDAMGIDHAGIWRDNALVDLFPAPASTGAPSPAAHLATLASKAEPTPNQPPADVAAQPSEKVNYAEVKRGYDVIFACNAIQDYVIELRCLTKSEETLMLSPDTTDSARLGALFMLWIDNSADENVFRSTNEYRLADKAFAVGKIHYEVGRRIAHRLGMKFPYVCKIVSFQCDSAIELSNRWQSQMDLNQL